MDAARSIEATALVWRLPSISHQAQQGLKLLALSLMIADHVHLVFFDRQLAWLYWLSRLVFPIFALIVAHNLERHRANVGRYISRLVFWGLLAQPAYWWCFHAPQLNVMFTLALGIGCWWLLGCAARRRVEAVAWVGVIAFAMLVPGPEFGWAGVLAVPMLAALLRRGAWWDWLGWFVLSFGVVGFGAPWPVPLVAVLMWQLMSKDRGHGRGSTRPKVLQRAYYAVYPLHLVAIAVMKTMI